MLEPKDDRLLPDLLPFICQTDAFFAHAVNTSAGSLSPRTNWTQLAQYEFALPPLAEQRWTAGVLWGIENYLQELRVTRNKLTRLRTAIIEDRISKTERQVDLGELLSDASYGCSRRANSREAGVPILRIPNVLREDIDLDDLKWVELSLEEIERYSVRDGDILIVRTNGNPEYVGRCVVVHDQLEPLTFASYLIRLRLKKDLANPGYIAAILNSPSLRRGLRGSVRSSAGNYNLNTRGIRSQKIPLPELQKQQELVTQVDLLQIAQDSISTRHTVIQRIKARILSDLGG